MVRAGASDSERRTRKRLIDPKLRAAGWRVVPYDPAHPVGAGTPVAIEEFPTENGPADYALCADGQLLGIVEAKKVTLGPQNVLTQAERYSRGATQSPLNFRGFHVPFLYATNGEVLFVWKRYSYWLASLIEKSISSGTVMGEKMTQANLAKAFRGELVPTEADLARAEGRPYELGSVLLARTRAEGSGGPPLAKGVTRGWRMICYGSACRGPRPANRRRATKGGAMDFDLKGYLENEPFTQSRPRLPLFEAVVNAIDAVAS